VVCSASPGFFHCGKVDFHHLYYDFVHSSCSVSFIFSHCLKLVGVLYELVHQTIVLIAVILSSLEFLFVALDLFSHINYLSHKKSLNDFPPLNNFSSCFPTVTSLPLLFITKSISFCVESFHSAWWPRSGILELIFLVAQILCHFLSNRSL
jgi:hypothetical protein